MPSFEMERYGMTNGSCPLVLCLQKPRRRFKHSYTVVRGSNNKSTTDRKLLLKPFAIGFFGTSRERTRRKDCSLWSVKTHLTTSPC